jgi:PAS domain S-box-containing protein
MDVVARNAAHLGTTEIYNGNNAQRLLSAIVESSEDAIISKDLRGYITSWNAAAERVFGYKAEEMIGRHITTLIPPELHPDEDRILATIAAGRRIEHFETVRVAKNGERIHVSLTISPVKDENGKIVGAAKIARDVTQRRRTEQALRTSEKLASVGRLAATVAHEINNPLEAVTNLVYLAQRSDNWHDVRSYLAIAEEELVRISHLAKQTLGFYRESKSAIPTRVGALLTSLTAVFSSRVRNKDIDFRSEIRQDPEIIGVPGELRQLIANLISNSIDAVPRRGRVWVRLSAARENGVERRKGVRLTVADSGPGIARPIRDHLFEPFFTTKKDVGTGLGLWVCKGIVDRHQGQIRVKSLPREGKSWTVFSIFLPLEASVAEAHAPLPNAA